MAIYSCKLQHQFKTHWNAHLQNINKGNGHREILLAEMNGIAAEPLAIAFIIKAADWLNVPQHCNIILSHWFWRGREISKIIIFLFQQNIFFAQNLHLFRQKSKSFLSLEHQPRFTCQNKREQCQHNPKVLAKSNLHGKSNKLNQRTHSAISSNDSEARADEQWAASCSAGDLQQDTNATCSN